MSNDKVRQTVNLLGVVAMIVVNGLANTLPLNGLQTGEISDRFLVYFVPAGYVFSIWGLIYLALAAFAVYQALPSQRENSRMRRIGSLFIVGCLANIAWIYLWHYQVFPLTIVAMVILLLTLILIYLRLDITREPVTDAEKWLVHVPFSLYLGWITVATVANMTSLLDYLQWGRWGISAEIWAVVMLAVGTLIASAVSLTRADVAYMLVIIWAYVGIAVKHTATPTVAVAAWVTAAITALMLVIGMLFEKRY